MFVHVTVRIKEDEVMILRGSWDWETLEELGGEESGGSDVNTREILRKKKEAFLQKNVTLEKKHFWISQSFPLT